MAINEYQFFNGVVLNGLVRKGKPLKIDIVVGGITKTQKIQEYCLLNKLIIYNSF